MDYSNRGNAYYGVGCGYGGQSVGSDGGVRYRRVDLAQVLAMQGLTLDSPTACSQPLTGPLPADVGAHGIGYGDLPRRSSTWPSAQDTDYHSRRYEFGSAQDEASYNVYSHRVDSYAATDDHYRRGTVHLDDETFQLDAPSLDYDDACSLLSEEFDNPSLDIGPGMPRAQLVAEMVAVAFETGLAAGREEQPVPVQGQTQVTDNTVTINYPPNTAVHIDVTLGDEDDVDKAAGDVIEPTNQARSNDRVAEWVTNNCDPVDEPYPGQGGQADCDSNHAGGGDSKGKDIAPRLQGGALMRHNRNARDLPLRPAPDRTDTSSDTDSEAERVHCPLCKRVCGSSWELNLHIKLAHTDYLCCPHGDCTYYTRRNGELVTHLTGHGDVISTLNEPRAVRQRVRFDDAGTSTAGSSRAMDPPSQELRRKRAVLCKHCDELFMGESALARREQHVSTAHPNHALNAYRDQLHDVESNVSRATCESCGKVYQGPRAADMLEKHVKHRHSKRALTTTYCKVCSKKFEGVGSGKMYADHVRVMHPQQYTCAKCSFTTSSKNKLRSHERKHNTQYRFSCPYCSEDFPYLDQQRSHTNYVHSDRSRNRDGSLEVESVHSSDGDDLYGE